LVVTSYTVGSAESRIELKSRLEDDPTFAMVAADPHSGMMRTTRFRWYREA
jgi:hypothetical protein